ncbi:MAG: sensor histidine kinase [Agriterribacter sp.]
MRYCRKILLLSSCVLLIIAGCKRKVVLKNSFYEPYFQKAKESDERLMTGILDTIATLFQKVPPGLKDKIEYYKLKSKFYKNTGRHASSLIVLDSLKTVLSSFNQNDPYYKSEYVTLLLSLAQDYTELKLFDEAINILMTSQEFIGSSVSSGCIRANYLDRIAQMMIVQGRDRVAIVYLEQSYKEGQLCSNAFERFYYGYNSLYKISSCYLSMSVYDSARHYCDLTMQYIVSNETKFPEKSKYIMLCKALVKGNIANVKAELKQYNEAEQLLLSVYTETADAYPQYALYCRLALLRIYVKAGMLVKAKGLIDFFDSDFKGKHAFLGPLQKKRLTTYCKNYYKKAGDFKNAFRFADETLLYYDSVSLSNTNSLARDPGLEFERRTQLMANELLQARYEQQSFQLLASGLLIVLVVIIAGFIAFHSKRIKKHAEMQESLNQEILLKNHELNDAYASLESSYQNNKELMLTVAHDLKNPIVGITTLAKVLLKKDPPTLRENLQLIVTASINATNLISNLMNRQGEKNDASARTVEDMMSLVKYSVELMKPRAEQKKQKLHLHGEPINVMMNKNEMYRVINNIIKFSPEKTSIHVSLQQEESNVVLSIKDQGIGIPPNILDILFVQGADAQRCGTAGEPSYGFGLKISKRIVEQHNGTIWAESVEGTGSTFFVKLPIAGKCQLNGQLSERLSANN